MFAFFALKEILKIDYRKLDLRNLSYNQFILILKHLSIIYSLINLQLLCIERF